MIKGTVVPDIVSNEREVGVGGELTRLAAKATDDWRSRHLSDSLNLFSSSSDPIARAAEGGCGVKVLFRKRGAERTHRHLPDELLQSPEDSDQRALKDVRHLRFQGSFSLSDQESSE